MTEERRTRRRRGQGGMIAVMAVFILLIMASTVILLLPGEEEKKNTSRITPTATPTAVVTPVPEEREQLAVVLEVDTEIKMVTVYDVEKEEEQRLVYTGATTFFDGHGIQHTAAQLVKGGLYQFTINTKEEWISTAKEAVDRREKPEDNGVWEKTGVDYFTMLDGKMSFRDQNYHYNDGLCVMNNGKMVQISDLKSGVDIITVRGRGQVVYEIVVTKGHGYIALKNHEDFVGGMIAIGSTRVDTVSEKAVYLVREGTYEVTVEHGEYEGTEKITVARDTTAEFDVFEYGSGPIKKGWLTINIEPLGASLYVDGEKTYYTDGLELDYGVYQFEFTEGGYISYKATVQIDQPRQSLSVFLIEQVAENTGGETDDPTKDPEINTGTEDDPDGTGSGTETGDTSGQDTGNSAGNSTGNGTQGSGGNTGISAPVQTSVSIAKLGQYRLNENNVIYILGPVGAEIYLDGVYLGKAPIDFEKIIGSYVITIITEDGTTMLKNMMETDNGADAYYNFSE
ncbi:MAG: PEGA domain-containing protein [Lachnospiraceae bacterium]|nr:PEGA domain-containing protein [Lachnospiraceae bacterium]